MRPLVEPLMRKGQRCPLLGLDSCLWFDGLHALRQRPDLLPVSGA